MIGYESGIGFDDVVEASGTDYAKQIVFVIQLPIELMIQRDFVIYFCYVMDFYCGFHELIVALCLKNYSGYSDSSGCFGYSDYFGYSGCFGYSDYYGYSGCFEFGILVDGRHFDLVVG